MPRNTSHRFAILAVSLLWLGALAGTQILAEEEAPAEPAAESTEAAWFALPPDLAAKFGNGKSLRIVVPANPRTGGQTICLASDRNCAAARDLATVTCLRADKCPSLQEYERIWGEPGVRPAPSPVTHELIAAPESDESDESETGLKQD